MGVILFLSVVIILSVTILLKHDARRLNQQEADDSRPFSSLSDQAFADAYKEIETSTLPELRESKKRVKQRMKELKSGRAKATRLQSHERLKYSTNRSQFTGRGLLGKYSRAVNRGNRASKDAAVAQMHVAKQEMDVYIDKFEALLFAIENKILDHPDAAKKQSA